jgi:hypothetical protein
MTLRPASALVWVEGADHYLDGYDEELAATTGWLAGATGKAEECGYTRLIAGPEHPLRR